MGEKMKKLLTICFGIALFLVGTYGTTRALPITIGFVPSSQTVQLGLPVTVDIVISGLGDGKAPSVGSYELVVTYDPTILLPTGITPGPSLGYPYFSIFEGIVDPGELNLKETSILLSWELDDLQPGSFALASISFDALAVGTSLLGFSQVIVGDTAGGWLLVDPGSGSVAVVPAPGTMVLLASGLIGLIAIRRRLRKS
jgi:hypothetical protein